MKRDAGFTLLEILVALSVLGFLVLGLGQGVRFGLLAWDRQTRVIGVRSDLDAIDRLLRRLIEQMDPGTQRDPPRIAGSARSLTFRTDLGPAAGPLEARDADIGVSVEAGRLLLRWRRHTQGRPFAALPAPQEVEILRSVAALEIGYWGVGDAAWRAEWSGASLPALVRLRLRFAEGDHRRWPDIIAAPLRGRPRG